MTLFHGLPSDQVRAVAQDAEGQMWFGTDAGLARYDGRRVQSVSAEGLAGPRVRALAADASGALWVGGDGGAFVRAPGSEGFKRVEETRGKSVLAVHTPSAGRALLATADGLIFDCRLGREGALTVTRLGERLTVAAGKALSVELTSLALEGGSVVVGTRGRGLMTIEPGGEAKEVAGRPRTFYVEALARDPGGALYMGAQTSASDSGILKIEEGRLARPSKVAGAATGTVTALASDPTSGDLYAATDGRGVFRLSAGRVAERFTFAGTAGALRSDRVNAVYVDREGVVWFGTPRGVCRYDPRGVRVEQLSAGESESNFVRSVYRTSRGRLLVGTNRGLFAREESSAAWREVPEVSGKTVYAVAEDRRGLLLVGTGAGLFVGLQTEGLRARSPVRLAPEEKAGAEGKGAKKDAGPAVENEKPADAAAVAESAVEAKEPAAVESKPEGGAASSDKSPPDKSASADAPEAKKVPEPALSGSVRAIATLGDAVYVATFGRGLERFGGPGRRELIWPRAGDDERGREVVSLYADESRGRLWVGTANAGVFYFDGSAVRPEPELAKLGGSTVWGVSAAEGWLWLATSRGLYAFREGRGLVEVTPGVDARAVIGIAAVTRQGDGAQASDSPRAWCATAGVGVLRVTLDPQFGAVTSRLDTEQGLPTDNAFAVLRLPASDGDGRAASEGGTLFVGTTRGLARYEPGTNAPALRLVRVTASRTLQPEELPRDGALRLAHPQNGLALDVAAAASRTFPEQFLYAFTLRDAKGRAVKQKLSRDSQFQAEALAAGAYTVTARAYTLDLVPSDPLVFNFEVARAPFPRTIVTLSVLLALALVVLAWGYLQHRRIVRSREELREANHQLASARLQLASEAEAERRRIARDLHDQTLADLRRLLLLTDEMQPSTVAAQTGAPGGGALVPAPPGSAADPVRLRAEIESISQEVRRICEDLSPSVLENVGFAAALEWALASACSQQPSAHRFAYDFGCDEDLEERLALSHGAQMQVYRIVQEAVSNVCRHARASHVGLSVRLDAAGDFLLTLSDDGRGFDAANKRALKGRGLAGIRARASLIEAEATWTPRDGGGTVFSLRKKDAARRDAPPSSRAPTD
ncbi:MAG TPA: two-component regulator propeller domain-containing protein [Pyrinomonadaceae bacterium]